MAQGPPSGFVDVVNGPPSGFVDFVSPPSGFVDFVRSDGSRRDGKGGPEPAR